MDTIRLVYIPTFPTKRILIFLGKPSSPRLAMWLGGTGPTSTARGELIGTSHDLSLGQRFRGRHMTQSGARVRE